MNIGISIFSGGLQPRDNICKWSSSRKRLRTVGVEETLEQKHLGNLSCFGICCGVSSISVAHCLMFWHAVLLLDLAHTYNIGWS